MHRFLLIVFMGLFVFQIGIGGASANSGALDNLPPEVSGDPTELLVENIAAQAETMLEGPTKQALQKLSETARPEAIPIATEPVKDNNILYISLIASLGLFLAGFYSYSKKQNKRNASV